MKGGVCDKRDKSETLKKGSKQLDACDTTSISSEVPTAQAARKHHHFGYTRGRVKKKKKFVMKMKMYNN